MNKRYRRLDGLFIKNPREVRTLPRVFVRRQFRWEGEFSWVELVS